MSQNVNFYDIFPQFYTFKHDKNGKKNYIVENQHFAMIKHCNILKMSKIKKILKI